MNEKAETKTRKKTEHTRMYAQLCSSTNEIFTSVVVYSRTTEKKQTDIKTMKIIVCFHESLFVSRCVNIKLDNKKKKKTEHTRIVAQLCSSLNAIFTSVVVYSRTTIKNKTKQKNQRVNITKRH